MTSEPVKFLLVDDIPENLVVLEALLRRDGLQLLMARSGAEALELLLVHEFALALLDVQMPGMDGFELAELMRGSARTKHVPIIFVTAGSRDPQRVFKGYESGAVDFLFKPLDPHVLKGKADVFFALHRQKIELAGALRLNEMFVGILGHDLRNPLGALLTGTQLLAQQLTDERHGRVLRRMTAAGQRMTDMIEQLLDLTRARLGGGLGFARVRQRLDVAALVQRAVEELQDGSPGRAIVVEQRGDCITAGDPDRLLQLLSNLLANALLHGQRDAPITATVEGHDQEIVVRVHNGGVVPPDILPTIFDPFRGRQQGRGGSHGLGLGLFITQQIAAAHGGRVDLDSSLIGGTAFTVHLPRRSPGPGPVNGAGRPGAVLIVEDDEATRASLRDALEDEGYQVMTAADGRAALDQLAREPRPEVVILDLGLPVVDGARVYRQMQDDPALARIPVIVSTANPGDAPAGAIVMPKPLKLARLLDKVAELVGQDHR